jgi:hypothetical protein
MVRTIVGDVEVQPFITDYKISITPVYGDNSFTDINGVEVQDRFGDKTELSLTLEEVPHAVALQLAVALQADSIEVTYTTPAPAVKMFKKTSYSAVCADSDPSETDYDITDGMKWEISLSLESTEYTAADGDRL